MSNAGLSRAGGAAVAHVAAPSGGLAEHVRDHLLEQLTSGTLRPGDRVNEAALARALGISRNPIREAVAALAGCRYLTAVPGRGHFIRTFSPRDVDDLFAFRIALETFAAREAMARMTLAERVGLCRMVDLMIEFAAAGAVAKVHDADVVFHRRLAELAGNRPLVAALDGIECEVRMLIAAVRNDRETPLQGAAGHRPIADAILAGDTADAVAALEAHIRATWANVVSSLSGEPAAGRAPRAAGVGASS